MGERNGRPTKIPVDPATGRPTDAPAASWSFEDAARGVLSGRCDGLGISIRDGLVGIDYDHVLNEDGEVKPERSQFIEEIQRIGSYTEVSPSGDGIHILACCDDIPADWKDGGNDKASGDTREFYKNGHYFTVTGNVWKHSPNKELVTVPAVILQPIYDKVVGSSKVGGGGKKKNVMGGEGKRPPAPSDITPPTKEEVDAAEEKIREAD